MRTSIKRALMKLFRLRSAEAREYPGIPFQGPALTARFPHKSVALFVTPKGNYVLPTDAHGDIIVKTIRQGKVFEQKIVDLAKRHIVPGSVVLDIGSNLGQMGVEFAKLTGPRGRVHCFEANNFIFELLKINLDLNGAAHAMAHFCAVWDKEGEDLFFPDPDFKRFESYGSYGIDPKAKAGSRVITRKIDEMELGGRVSFIKVDIQGSDLFALRGARETILRDEPIIIFEFEKQFQKEFGTSFKDYMAFIEEIGYKVLDRVKGINFVIGPKVGIPRKAFVTETSVRD